MKYLPRKAQQASIGIAAGLALVLHIYEQQMWFGICKGLTTLLIIVLAWQNQNEIQTHFWKLALLALAFCLLGDLLLLKSDLFVFGLAAFLIAHILFAIGFISISGFHKKIGVAIILLVFGSGYYGYLLPHLDALALPVSVYVLAILFMAWQGISLAFDFPDQFRILGMGCVFFMLSDAILAFNKFVQPFNWSGILVLSTYWVAIYLLALSTRSKLDFDKN